MAKKLFFRKPKVSEIIKDKIRIERRIALEDFLESVESIKKGEYLAICIDRIREEIIPQTSQSGIPYVSINDPHYYLKLWQRFLKRGRYVELNNNDVTQNNLIKRKEPPYKTRERLIDKLRVGEDGICGIGWWDPKTNIHNSTSIRDLFEGAKIFAYSERSSNEREKIQVKYEYDLKSGGKDIGADVLVRVPSEEIGKKPYFMALRSVAVNLNPERFAIAWSFNADHSCEFKAARSTGRYSGRESYMCHHIVAAYIAFASEFYNHYKRKNRKKAEVPLEMCLFGIPSEILVNTINKLRNNVVFEYRDDEGKRRRKSPNIVHDELIAWQLVEREKTKKTLYTSKALKDYKW